MTRVLSWLWLLFLLTLPVWMTNQYYLHVLIGTGIFTIAAMSLNLLLGFTGQLSLGHVAFFGIGGYTSALVSLGFDLHLTEKYMFVFPPQPVWLAFLAGIAVAGAFGWFIGKISFKVRGAYFVIVTISFAVVVRLVALNWVDLTEGPMALNNIPPLTLILPGLGKIAFYKKLPNYYLVLAVCVVSFIIIRRLVYSRIGRAFIALRENETLAESVGVDVTRFLVLAAIVSAAIAGAAGCLYTHYIRIIDPDVFLFIYTVTMVIMVITGGKGTLAGPIVGGLIFGTLPEALREVARPEVQWIIYGGIMIVIIFFLPQGIVPALQSWWKGRQASQAVPAGLRAVKRGGGS
jgi:branched-chain amino acid transport system permease protein